MSQLLLACNEICHLQRTGDPGNAKKRLEESRSKVRRNLWFCPKPTSSAGSERTPWFFYERYGHRRCRCLDEICHAQRRKKTALGNFAARYYYFPFPRRESSETCAGYVGLGKQ